MKALLLLPLLLAADVAPAPPTLADRLAFNARERTARGLAALDAQHPNDAVGPFDAALRLAPADPLVRFNAGSGHLAAGDPDAATLLEQATEGAPPDLAPAAWYNLGNARLAASNPQGAVAAYREALLRQPAFAAAKHNLELALRELERQRQEQQKQQKQQKQQQQQQKQQEQEQKQQQQQKQPGQGEKKPEEEQQQPQQEPQPQRPGGEGEQGEQRNRPLPRFQDQKDMTAEQAAAILQAVENLERQQRREQALEQARAKAQVEKDW